MIAWLEPGPLSIQERQLILVSLRSHSYPVRRVQMNLTRRRLLSSAIAAGAAVGLNRNVLSAATSLGITPPDLAGDPRRPQFHLVPPSNWINDPNGPIYWNGMYHMFYQSNPTGTFIGNMQWGHAVSPDMLHWKHMPTALISTPGGPDADGCWTGTAVVDNGVVTVLYTGVARAREAESTVHNGATSLHESQCLAYSKDPDLKTWTKLPAPVIAAPPPGMKVSGFRDPSPWREGDEWYTIVGSGTPHQSGEVLLYKSRDLRHWEYLHAAAEGSTEPEAERAGDMWECPELFPLGDKHVLIHSSNGKAHWEVGTLDKTEMRFHSQQQGILDNGAYYAPKTQRDKSGHRVIWGWILETRPEKEYSAAGWAGMMSLPRVLTVGDDGRLRIAVAPVVDSLRRKQQSANLTADEEENKRQISRMYIENCCGQILCTTRAGDEPCSLTLFGTHPKTGAEFHCVAVHYDPRLPNRVMIDDQSVPLDLANGRGGNQRGLEINIYVDGSVAEVFLNRQAAYTKRFYYPGSAAPRVGVRIAGKTANLSSLSVWQLTPVSTDRLTT